MIHTLEVENFKRLHRLKVEHLSRVTLIGGRNNVGKSTLLEAAFLLHDRYSASVLLRHWAFRGAAGAAHDPESLFGAAFTKYDTSSTIGVASQNSAHRFRVEIRFERELRKHRIRIAQRERIPQISQEVESGQPQIEALHLAYFRDDIEVNRGDLLLGRGDLELKLQSDREEVPMAVFIGSRSISSLREVADRFSDLDVRNESENVVEVLREIHPTLKGLGLQQLGDMPVLHADVGLGRKVPVNLLGDGTNRLLTIILAMSHGQGGMALIDEVDSGFHYSVMPRVWKAIDRASKRFNCQILATTHSYGCLASAVEGLEPSLVESPELTYIRLDELGGQVVPRYYPHSQLSQAISDEWEVR
ncbi:MAG: AAA family ATPase [Phycisphaeraceae bacterium]